MNAVEFDLRAFAGCAGYDVVGIFKETGSGTKLDRAERKKVQPVWCITIHTRKTHLRDFEAFSGVRLTLCG